MSESAPSQPPQPTATDEGITGNEAPLLKLAAIDLGSNSFHLLLANHQAGQLQVVAKQGEKVQLAAGLDEDGMLSEEAMERASTASPSSHPSSTASRPTIYGSWAPTPCAPRITVKN